MRTPPRISVAAKFHHMYSKDLGHPDSKQTDCRSEDTIKIGQSAESLHGQLFKNLSHKTKSSNQFKCSVQKCHWRLIWVFKKKRGALVICTLTLLYFRSCKQQREYRMHVTCTCTYRSNMEFVEVFYQHLFRHFWVCDDNTWFEAFKKSGK